MIRKLHLNESSKSINAQYTNDVNVIKSAFPLHGYVDLDNVKDSVIDRLVNFIRTTILQIPDNYKLSIAEYLCNETEEIDKLSEVKDFLQDCIRDIDSDYFSDDSESLFCLGYLEFGENYYLSM